MRAGLAIARTLTSQSCAVREAEDAGQIDSLRLETFQNLASSMRVSAQMLDPDVHL